MTLLNWKPRMTPRQPMPIRSQPGHPTPNIRTKLIPLPMHTPPSPGIIPLPAIPTPHRVRPSPSIIPPIPSPPKIKLHLATPPRPWHRINSVVRQQHVRPEIVPVGPGGLLGSGRPATYEDVGTLVEEEVFPSAA